MMDIKNKIIIYLRLIRPQAAAMTASILLIGALTMGQRDLLLLFAIFSIGIISHIYGFVLNDYADIEVDKKSPELKEKPLVSGVIPKKHALTIIFISGFFGYALTIVFFPSLLTLLLLTFAAIMASIYNYYGKKILGSEFIISAGLALFCLFGASTVSTKFTNTIYIISLLLFIDSIFIHAVEGGLKDADHDYLKNVKTLPTTIGIKVKKGILLITKKFIVFSYGLKAIYFGLIIILGFQPEINLWYSNNYLIHIITAFFTIIIIILTYKFLHLPTFNRTKMKRIYAGLNSASLALIIIMLSSLIEIEIILVLLLLPITWYIIFNTIIYGKPLQPQV